MTFAGVKTAPAPAPARRGRAGRPGPSARRSVVVARVRLSAPAPPLVGPPLDREGRVEHGQVEMPPMLGFEGVEVPSPCRRSDLHVARRLRRRAGLVGLGVLMATLGGTVAVLDVFH